MEERKKEIEVHEDVQRAEIKMAEEERHKLALEVKERQMKVKTMKAKFETLAACKPGAAEGEESKSQAYFVIKAAQQKEELQREGDELDSKIRTAEREIRALEATLNHLIKRNSVFRSGFQKADMEGAEAATLRALEEEVKTASDLLFKKRKELQRVVNDAEDDQNRLQQGRDQLKQ